MDRNHMDAGQRANAFCRPTLSAYRTASVQIQDRSQTSKVHTTRRRTDAVHRRAILMEVRLVKRISNCWRRHSLAAARRAPIRIRPNQTSPLRGPTPFRKLPATIVSWRGGRLSFAPPGSRCSAFVLLVRLLAGVVVVTRLAAPCERPVGYAIQ